MTATRRLGELRATELARRLTPSSVVLQPIAAIEQHGPHLPLSTDLLIVDAVIEGLLAARGEELDLWVLPSLAYGKSTEHEWSPGTISLSSGTLLAVLDDLGRSLAPLATKRVVFVNSHGGNVPLLGVALRDLRRRHALSTFLANALPAPAYSRHDEQVDREAGLGVHAGRDETSLVLHLRPELVDLGGLASLVPPELAPSEHVRFGGDVSFGWLSDDFGESGVIGDPSSATAEHGRALLQSVVERLGVAMSEVRNFRFTC